MSIRERMTRVLEAAPEDTAVATEPEAVDEKGELWDLVLAIAVVAKSQGNVDPDKLVDQLKQLGTAKKMLVAKAVKKVASGGKAAAVARDIKKGL